MESCSGKVTKSEASTPPQTPLLDTQEEEKKGVTRYDSPVYLNSELDLEESSAACVYGHTAAVLNKASERQRQQKPSRISHLRANALFV